MQQQTTHRISLREDMHVHSTFSDGRNTIDENVRRAEALRLSRMTCVDHVRADSTWIPEFVHAVRALQSKTNVHLFTGVEAKLLDETGRLDLPDNLDGVDFVYVADHRMPLGDELLSPKAVRRRIDEGVLSRTRAIDALVRATVGGIRSAPVRPVLAHLFSALPKAGMSEHEVTLGQLHAIALALSMSGGALEIDERWRCPGPRTVQVMQDWGVPIFASTDSHRRETIGVYDYVARIRNTLETSRTR